MTRKARGMIFYLLILEYLVFILWKLLVVFLAFATLAVDYLTPIIAYEILFVSAQSISLYFFALFLGVIGAIFTGKYALFPGNKTVNKAFILLFIFGLMAELFALGYLLIHSNGGIGFSLFLLPVFISAHISFRLFSSARA